jgi:hypothetical protein
MEVIALPKVDKFIKTQDQIQQSRILRMLNTLEKEGYKIEYPFSAKVKGEIFELRVMGKRQFRLSYIFRNNKTVVFYAYEKKTQKIPRYIMRSLLDTYKNIDYYIVYVIYNIWNLVH